ncbi:MAG TPA: Flp family type IVb pilin [Gemmatimonadaceae bacterium]|nr:Flp family type IVb pilin [Gemmatimonadaceae bacterium]
MSKIRAQISRFVGNEEGATMVEYGLMLALIAAVCVVIIGTLGTNANTMFNTIQASL